MSLVIREMQIETATNYRLTPTRTVRIFFFFNGK